MLLSTCDLSDRSVSQKLLARSLMLKAWSSCWTTLGLAVRVAQSIGLHVEDAARTPEGNSNTFSYELRRRTWYSIYVLDRLLALQLGRPPAIYEGDFSVGLPSRLDDTAMSDVVHTSSQASNEGPLAGDYFIAMIQFSQIIGRVLRGLYSLSRVGSAEGTLSAIENLDRELLQWKNSLPRVLRFDLAHTFESSTTFKRQASKQSPMTTYV
jgi:Fungal specific transcription factor domain